MTPFDNGGLSDEQFRAAARRLDELVREFESLPYPQVQEQVFELLQTVDVLHRAGLGRLVAFLHRRGAAELLDEAADDPVIHTLFALYDLVETDERTQVETALTSVLPYIHSHGGEVEVLDVVDGIVHLRLAGACRGCAGSAITLQRGIRAALQEGFPGFRDMEVHDPAPPARASASPGGFISLDQLVGPQSAARRPVFQAVARLRDLPPDTMKSHDVDGVRILLANVAGEVYAVRDQCPGNVAPLSLGSFTPPVVVCPWHNEAFDVRTGKRADGSTGPNLAVLPIALDGDVIKLAVNTLAGTPAGGRSPERG